MNNLKIGIVCYPTQGGSGIVAKLTFKKEACFKKFKRRHIRKF